MSQAQQRHHRPQDEAEIPARTRKHLPFHPVCRYTCVCVIGYACVRVPPSQQRAANLIFSVEVVGYHRCSEVISYVNQDTARHKVDVILLFEI